MGSRNIAAGQSTEGSGNFMSENHAVDRESFEFVETTAELRDILGEVSERAATKVRTCLHELERKWLGASPFCLMATSDTDGSCDVSPKGDPAGFTRALDDRTIVVPERLGTAEPTVFTTFSKMATLD